MNTTAVVKQSPTKSLSLSNPIIFALILGILAQLTYLGNLSLTINTPVASLDLAPNEIFVAISGPLAGPFSGLISAVLGPKFTGLEVRWILQVIIRIIATVWMAYGYRYIHLHLKPIPRLAAWIGLIAVYYFGVLALPFSIIFYTMGRVSTLAEAYLLMASSLGGEFIMTAVFSGLIMVALPKRFQRPLWIDFPKQTSSVEGAVNQPNAA